MVLRDITVHAEHEESAALLAVVGKSERLPEIQVACAEWLEGSLKSCCCSDRVQNAIHRRIDRAWKTVSGSEVEQIDCSAAVGSVTEYAVLCFSRQHLASPYR